MIINKENINENYDSFHQITECDSFDCEICVVDCNQSLECPLKNRND